MTMNLTARNILLARKAKKQGMQNSLRIIIEARRVGLPLSLAFAMVEQESGNGANIWGGDGPPNGNTHGMDRQPVTRARYLRYKEVRGPEGRGGMQGVGPLQLTYYTLQDYADHLGGCWVPKHNLHVGFEQLASLIKQKGRREGVKAYNGTGPGADAYTAHVNDVLAPKWHRILGS